jgi:tRNA(adenine34) deaminase
LEDNDREFLMKALDLARSADQAGDVPIGAVLVAAGGRIVAADRNYNVTKNDRLQHAEMRVLRQVQFQVDMAPPPLTLYSTLEPCPMCFGAAVVARLNRIVWACNDPFGGAASSAGPWPNWPTPEGLGEPYDDLREESRRLLMSFFTRSNWTQVLRVWASAGYDKPLY